MPVSMRAGVQAGGLRQGAAILAEKLETWGAPLVVFVFKRAAEQVLGHLKGSGFVPGVRLGPSEVFVMPGPYERRDRVDDVLDSLRRWSGED